MAFQRDTFNSFYEPIKQTQHIDDSRMRVIATNFILEERLTVAREDSYQSDVTSPGESGEWESMHENYLYRQIYRADGEIPETFTGLNDINVLPELGKDQSMVRLENMDELISIAGYPPDDRILLMEAFEKYINGVRDIETVEVVEGFLTNCNSGRDARPIFAGFCGEVRDILNETGEQWANRFRDRFGLGHLDPRGKEPIPVLLLHYCVADIISQEPESSSEFAAVPTVLDSGWHEFFCPTPKHDDYNTGFTLDLTPVPDDALTREILHRYIDYKPDYACRVGWITEPPGKTCEAARQVHLEYFGDDFQYFELL